jgi:hypothetical protein
LQIVLLTIELVVNTIQIIDNTMGSKIIYIWIHGFPFFSFYVYDQGSASKPGTLKFFGSFSLFFLFGLKSLIPLSQPSHES